MRYLVRIIASVSLHLALIAFSACVMSQYAVAQGARHNDIALGRDGHIAPGASIAVCTAQGIIGYANSPCSPLASIYTDATLAAQAANPFVADNNGDYGFWAPPGTYQVQVYGPEIGTYIQTVTIPCVPNTTAVGCGGAGATLSVKAFGAKCDDATDDTFAIQSAINALPTSGASIGGLVAFSGVCKTTAGLVINTPNVTLEGSGHFQFITQNSPPSYIDFQAVVPANAITVNAQGFAMKDLGVKYPTTLGGPVAAPAAPTLAQVAGSGCPVEPYYAEITYVTAQGETNVSAEAAFTTTSGNCLQVLSPPSASGVTGWNVYVSANPNNETRQTSAPLAIGTNWTFTGTLANLGFRPPFNTTAYSAIYDNNGAQLDGVKLFTNAASSAGTAQQANGYTSLNCCGKLHNVYIAGFGLGVAGAGSNNDFSITDSYIQSNYVGALIVNGADINIVRDDFEGNVAGNIKMLYGSPYTIAQNYFEQQGTNPPSYNVQIGDSAIPPQGFTPTPGAVVIAGNFMQCNLTAYPPAPIVIDTAQSLRIERNSFSQCAHQNIIDNLAGAGANIKVLGNISDAAPLSWLTSTNGLTESDINGAQLTPGTPFFYGSSGAAGLGIDSSSGNSSLLFRSAGGSAWNLNASTSALSFGFSAHTGENTLQLKPFGTQSFASVQSNYAMDAAEIIVTRSGASTAFDAGLGNTFEITLSANVTSSTLANAQPGQWLAFIICQGAGGPYTFAWPSNVFGGGTIGTVGGNCSTQEFYASGGNAWAVTPMITNLSTGLAGLSLPAVSGTVPYFTGAWTNGDCLQAGGSPGLISVTSSACGTGGGGGSPGGTNTAVQFNNSGAFGGDATNFFYNNSTHALTITGPFTASTLTLTNQNTFTLGSGSQTNASFFYAQSGSAANNAAPAYLELSGSPANTFNSFLYPCQSAGNFCVTSTTPSTDSNRTLATHSGVNAQTGTSYTIQSSDEDGLTTFNNAAAIAVTLPCPSGTNFANGWRDMLKVTGAGTPTITTSGCNINGSTTFAIPPAGIWLVSDGVNYWTVQ